MRTRLLQILPCLPRTDHDYGEAANDGRFHAATFQILSKTIGVDESATPAANDDHDDYWLGGYAGI